MAEPDPEMPTDEPVVSEARLMGRAVGVYFAELLSTPGVTRSMATRLVRDWQFAKFELEPVDDDEDEPVDDETEGEK